MVVPKSKQKKISDTVAGKKILIGIWKKREIEYVEKELVIKLSGEKKEFPQVLKKLQSKELKGSKILRPIDKQGTVLLNIEGDVLEICKLLNQKSDVAFVEPNFISRAAEITPNDADYSQQWSLPLIGMPEAWDIDQGNSQVMIAIVDSGIPMAGTPLALSHPDLNDTNRIILGNDLVHQTTTPWDEFGHGTHVAGIASANSNNSVGIAGVSWNTQLYIIKIFDSNGHGTTTGIHDAFVEAVDYSLAHSLRLVINFSGVTSQSAIVEIAVKYAHDHNVLIVAAAGNDYGGNVGFPAAYSTIYDNMIAVSATDSNDALASYSNIGAEINVAAPGSNIYSCMPNYVVTLNSWGYSQNYDHMDGTSMATPHVSGLAALLLSYDNTMAVDKVRQIIEDNALDLGALGWDQNFGYGRIDAYAALDSLVPIHVCPFKTEIQCWFIKESCAFKEYCLYNIEHIACKIKMDVPCIFRVETACYFIKEIGCIKFEGCLKEGGIGCMKENVFQPPWGDVYVKKGDPMAEPVLIKRDLKHVKPLTRALKTVRNRIL